MESYCLTEDQKKYIEKSIEVVEARLNGMDRAAVLKAEEVDRRLEDHNKLREEVIIVNQKEEFIGIGTAKIAGLLMKEMKSGVAVDTRKGVGMG